MLYIPSPTPACRMCGTTFNLITWSDGDLLCEEHTSWRAECQEIDANIGPTNGFEYPYPIVTTDDYMNEEVGPNYPY